MSTKRFFYHIHPNEIGCTCVTQDTLDHIATEVGGECIGNCIIQSDTRLSRKAVKLLEDGFKVTIDLRDSIKVHAKWLLSVAELYPDATIAQLCESIGKHEFSGLM
jgi:hypothetical protein